MSTTTFENRIFAPKKVDKITNYNCGFSSAKADNNITNRDFLA